MALATPSRFAPATVQEALQDFTAIIQRINNHECYGDVYIRRDGDNLIVRGHSDGWPARARERQILRLREADIARALLEARSRIVYLEHWAEGQISCKIANGKLVMSARVSDSQPESD